MKIFKNFKEVQTLKPGFSSEHIFGGAMLGIAGSDFVCFYDWTSAKVRPPVHMQTLCSPHGSVFASFHNASHSCSACVLLSTRNDLTAVIKTT